MFEHIVKFVNLYEDATHDVYACRLFDFYKVCYDLQGGNPLIGLESYKTYLNSASGRYAPATMKNAYSVLKMYSKWATAKGYQKEDYMAQIRQPKRYLQTQQTKEGPKCLLEGQINGLLTWLDAKEHKRYERANLMIRLCYEAYLRVSELVDFKYSQFIGPTTLAVIGKGNKLREIPINEELVIRLSKWYHIQGYNTDAVFPMGNRQPLHSKRRIQYIITNAFREYADYLDANLAQESGTGLAFRRATPHWLRHSGISHAIKRGRPIEHVRDDAGHSSITTTNGYIHTTIEDRRKTL